MYHLVRDTIKNPRKTFSSRRGAKTPVMPSKQAVLRWKPVWLHNFLNNLDFQNKFNPESSVIAKLTVHEMHVWSVR